MKLFPLMVIKKETMLSKFALDNKTINKLNEIQILCK